MHIPTVDIGDRQKGRVFADSILHCEKDKNSIEEAIRYAGSPLFKEQVRRVKNPVGDGTTSQQMVDLLKKITSKKISVKKTFYDLNRGDIYE